MLMLMMMMVMIIITISISHCITSITSSGHWTQRISFQPPTSKQTQGISLTAQDSEQLQQNKWKKQKGAQLDA